MAQCFSLYLFSTFLSPVRSSPDLCSLSLHDALPIWFLLLPSLFFARRARPAMCPKLSNERALPSSYSQPGTAPQRIIDRKSTRLNSSHLVISYAVFCLKKKKNLRYETE